MNLIVKNVDHPFVDDGWEIDTLTELDELDDAGRVLILCGVFQVLCELKDYQKKIEKIYALRAFENSLKERKDKKENK